MKNLFILLIISGFCGIANAQQTVGTGTVRGKLCFPSEYIPSMKVYLKNVESGAILKMVTKSNQSTFEFKHVPVGTYLAYAYEMEGMGGGYTKAVPCGLQAGCDDHTLIQISVSSGKTVTKVDICDWYDAVLPPME